MMKAIFARKSGEYGLTERPVPTPALDEALVKVARAGICHTDVVVRATTPGHLRYPFIPGHEFSGVVETCGPAVKYIAPGDRVAVHHVMACGQCPACWRGDTEGCHRYDELGSLSDGGFAEYCAVPARHLFKLPDHVTLGEGAMVEPLANAVSAVRQAEVHVGDQVVVIGPGPIGLLALQVAGLAHPSVLVLVGTRDGRLQFGEQLGATHTVNIHREGSREALNDILGGRGADVVVQCAGTLSAAKLAVDIVGWRGRVALEGGASELLPLSLDALMRQSARVMGINGWNRDEFAQSLDLISSGLVDAESLITHTFPLDEWETAFEMVTVRKDEAVKVHLAP